MLEKHPYPYQPTSIYRFALKCYSVIPTVKSAAHLGTLWRESSYTEFIKIDIYKIDVTARQML